MAMTPARRKEIEINHKERQAQKQRTEELENVYQNIAGLIMKEAVTFHVYDDRYPNLVIKNDTIGKKYEIIIKEVK